MNNCQFNNRHVWPWAEEDSIGHDSFLCDKYLNTRPFPTQRNIGANNFVGSDVNVNWTISSPCPIPCRPDNHKDWLYC